MGAKTIPPHSSPLKRYISGSGEPVICQAEWQEEGREQLTLSEMARIWFRNPLQHNILVRNIKRVTREQEDIKWLLSINTVPERLRLY